MRPTPQHRGDPLFLPDLLRYWGVNVQEWPGWKTRGHGDFGAIQGVFAHHTGTNTDIPGYIAQHPDLGLCSQIHLNRDGTAVITGAGIAWHAGRGSYPGWPTNNANQVSIGIEAASDGTSPWPEAELDAYRKICAAILWYLGKRATPQTLLGHKEYSGAAQGKWDPGGIDMDKFRAEVNWWIDNPPFEKKQEMQTMSDAIAFTRTHEAALNDDKLASQRAELHARDARAQLTGSTEVGKYPGWPQLGGRTVVDALAAIGEKLGLDGFKDPKEGK